jgi:uncharacterized protein
MPHVARTLSRWLREIENEVARALRHPRSRDVLDRETAPFDPSRLRGHRYVLLVTTRRDGRLVSSPMWFAADGDRLVLRSGRSDPKLARIRRDTSVHVAPCDLRGRPLGPPMRARARILRPEEEDAAELALARVLGWQRGLYSLIRVPLLPMAYLEVTSSG